MDAILIPHAQLPPGFAERVANTPATANPVEPRRAATVACLRDAEGGPQVLLVRRPGRGFAAGAWVYPGGAVDPEDESSPDPLRAAARREVMEETGLDLPGSDEALISFAHWITPRAEPRRYDTHFFVIALAPDAEGHLPSDELMELTWIRPADALDRFDRGEWRFLFPTLATLRLLSGHPDVATALERMAALPRQTMIPRLVVTPDGVTIVPDNDTPIVPDDL